MSWFIILWENLKYAIRHWEKELFLSSVNSSNTQFIRLNNHSTIATIQQSTCIMYVNHNSQMDQSQVSNVSMTINK